jgi:hypothetical protein
MDIQRNKHITEEIKKETNDSTKKEVVDRELNN